MLTDIARSPIAETVRKLSAERRSGDLQVRSGRMVKIAFFDHGRLVFAASNLRRDRLGEALVADGRITQHEFDRVSALMRADRGRRFGEALVQAGVMDRYEVGTAVARQVRRVALSLFELTDGAALFEERASLDPPRVHDQPLRAPPALRRHPRHEGPGPPPQGPRVPRPRRRAGGGPPVPLRAERADRRRSWRSSTSPSGASPSGGSGGPREGSTFPRLRAVYALLAAGILREADAASAPQPVLQTETGMFLLSALHNRPDPSLRDAIRREVQQELEHSARLDRDAWLKLARAAPRDELVRALEEKMERYHALRDGVSEDDSLRTDIDVILGRASSALRLARQAPETASADAVLARHAAEAAAAIAPAPASRRRRRSRRPPGRAAAVRHVPPGPSRSGPRRPPARRRRPTRPGTRRGPRSARRARPTRPTRPGPARRLAAHRRTRGERLRGPGADRAPPHGGRGPDDRRGLRERGEGLREAREGRAPRGRVPPPPRGRDGLLPARPRSSPSASSTRRRGSSPRTPRSTTSGGSTTR